MFVAQYSCTTHSSVRPLKAASGPSPARGPHPISARCRANSLCPWCPTPLHRHLQRTTDRHRFKTNSWTLTSSLPPPEPREQSLPDSRRVYVRDYSRCLRRCCSVAICKCTSHLNPLASILSGGVAELLDSQRGVIVIPRPARQRQVLRGRPDRSPLDVPDVHMKGHHAHLRMLKRVLAESTELASQLGRLPSLGAPSEKRDRLGLV